MKHGSLIAPDEGSFGFGTSKTMFDATSAGHQSGETVTVPDAALLFNGEFKRAGDDLKIIGQDGKSFLVEDYFKKDKHPTLLSPEGAALTPDVVDALAGPLAPGQYAQAGTPQSANQAIGRVEKVEGNATVVRNGVTITLNTGDVIQKGDVAQTGAGGSLAIVFSDGTAFNLAANARMVLNDFVYSAGGSNNSALISLVQGSISFVAGQVAKTGDMRVETPVATMGIRGTAVLVEVSANNGQTKFSVMVEPNGEVGSFNLYDKSTGNLIATVNSSSIGWVVTPTGPLQVLAQQVQKTPAELARELFIVQQVFQTFNSGPFDPNAPQPPQQPNDPNKRGDTDTNTKTAGGPSGTPGSVTGDVIKVNIVSPTGANGQTGPTNPTNPNPNDPNAGDPTGPGDPGAPGAPDGSPQTQTLSINTVYGSANNDNPLAGSDNDDMIFGGAGDDVFIAAHGKGNDFFDGDGDGDNPSLPDFEGLGDDTIRFDSAESAVTFELNGIAVSNFADSESTDHDTFINIETVVGGRHDDVFNLHTNDNWVIDGGYDIEDGTAYNDFDVIKLVAEFDVEIGPNGIKAQNIEMLDLDNNFKNKIYVEGEGAVDINDDHTVRVVADGKDTVILSGGGDEGHWVRVGTPQTDVTDGECGLFSGDDHTDGVQFQKYEFVDDYGCVKATAYIDTDATIDIAPIAGADTITNATPPDGEGWVLNEDNGHYYRVIEWDVTWHDAAYYAAQDGVYLASITSQSEQDFVHNLTNGIGGWLGAYGPDAANAGTWHWVGGPEANSSLSYENWNGNESGSEPNGGFGEPDAGLHMEADGGWNDVPTSWNQSAFVEEWGGLSNQIAFREDTATTLTVSQLLQNDTDAEDNPLTITSVSATSTHGGTVTLDEYGIITYVPVADYTGPDSFTYTLSDGTATSTGTVTFDVAPDALDIVLPGEMYLTFDGSSYAASTPASSHTDNVTMEGWIRWDGTPSNGHGEVLIYNGNTSTNGYGVFGDVVDGSLHLNALTGGQNVMASDAALSANEWHHVALVRDNGEFHLYVDGIEVSLDIANSVVNPIVAGNHTFIGGNPDNAYEGFHGDISDVRLWDAVRTPIQIADARFDSLTGNESGLVGYWPLNDGDGTFSSDHSGSSDLVFSGNPEWTFSADGGHPTLASEGVHITEDHSATIRGISVTDSIASDGDIHVTLGAGHGHFALTNDCGLDVQGSGTGTLTLTGTLSEINAALASGFVYTPDTDYAGNDQITLTVNDEGTPHTGAQTESLKIDVAVAPVNDAPVIHTDQATTGGTEEYTIVSGLSVTDADDENGFIVSLHTTEGALLFADNENAAPQKDISFSGTLADVNEKIGEFGGVVYVAPTADPEHPETNITDMVTMTTNDGHGGVDTVNFIFNATGPGGVSLTGTDQKDVLFGTGGNDTLEGGDNADTFVFDNKAGYEPIGHDTVNDFMVGVDKIDLGTGFDNVPTTGPVVDFNCWVNTPGAFTECNGNTTIHLSDNEDITLKNVVAASLTANDFIIHPGTA